MNTFGNAAGGGRRKTARAQAPQLALLSTVATDRRVGLVDVSTNGVHLIAPDAPAEGEDVIFQAESIQLFGRVAWVHGGECGISFAAPMCAEQVNRLKKEAITQTSSGADVKHRSKLAATPELPGALS
jgi:hypothetical protein